MWLIITIFRALLRKYKVLSTVSIASQISSGTGPLCYKEPYRNLDVTAHRYQMFWEPILADTLRLSFSCDSNMKRDRITLRLLSRVLARILP